MDALNYAAQAVVGLSQWADRVSFEEEKNNVFQLADKIKDATHFVLPRNGRIFDDRLKGIEGDEIHLPYPQITLSYFADDTTRGDGDEKMVAVPRRVIYAEESVDYIQIFGVVEYRGFWMPLLAGATIPKRWDDPCLRSEAVMIKPIVVFNQDAPKIIFKLAYLCPNLIKNNTNKYGEDQSQRDMHHDIGGEVTAVLELCEALSCNNVRAEIIQKENKKVNRKRMKRGKLPLYEVRTLVVDQGKEKSVSSLGEGGNRVSPRMHLRRGHIRKAYGHKIWVQSCVVGSAKNGLIEKNYRIVA